MKKTYFAPKVETIVVKTHGMLAMSVQATEGAFSGTKEDVLGREAEFDDEEY